MRAAALGLIYGCFLLFIRVTQSAAETICPESVLPSSADALAYQPREDRCEGLFLQPVTVSSHIRIIGFHDHAPAFTPGSNNPIRVIAKGAPAGEKVAVNGVSTRFRQFYRMDTVLPLAGVFPWKREVMNNPRINLTPSNLAMIACSAPGLKSQRVNLDVPLCSETDLKLFPVSAAENVAPRQAREIVFTAATDISKLIISVVRVADKKLLIDRIDAFGGEILHAETAKPWAFEAPPGAYSVIATAVPRNGAGVSIVKAEVVVP